MLGAVMLTVLGGLAPASSAKAFADKGAWDDLYLAYSAAKPDAYSEKDRRLIAAALVKGCLAVEPQDAVLAYSMADKSAQLSPTPDGLLCLARTGDRAEQRDSAEKALRQGVALFPKDARFALELGRQLLEDRDASAAEKVLRSIPNRAHEYAEAQEILHRARSQGSSEHDARQQTAALERRINYASGAHGATGRVVSAKATASTNDTLTYSSDDGPDGMRTRSNRRFSMKYFKNGRDFAQRADYEGKVAAALDEAWGASQNILGRAREKSCDVILYTKDEFAAHFSAAFSLRVAGLYSMDAIRMNGAEEIDDEQKSVLVHEYVHSVVDEVSGYHSSMVPIWLNEGLAEYVRWRYLGGDGPPHALATLLRTAASANHLPRLAMMDRSALIEHTNPWLAYGFSAMATRRLFENGGASKLLRLIAETGEGKPFAELLQREYGLDVEALQASVAADVSSR